MEWPDACLVQYKVIMEDGGWKMEDGAAPQTLYPPLYLCLSIAPLLDLLVSSSHPSTHPPIHPPVSPPYTPRHIASHRTSSHLLSPPRTSSHPLSPPLTPSHLLSPLLADVARARARASHPQPQAPHAPRDP